MITSKWMIWSIEHDAWWKADHVGYTKFSDEAGLYSFDEARKIVDNANEFCDDRPNEAMIEAREL